MLDPTSRPSARAASPDSARHVAVLGQLAALADLPGVREAADAAREAATRLRFHEALRRRIPEAAAESRIRGARASAALDGADVPVDLVRELMSGARPWPDDADAGVATLHGAVAATAESERIVPLLRTAPLQALARLHLAAGAPLVGRHGGAGSLGRPRVGSEGCAEFVDLGPAPSSAAVSVRLAALSDVVLAATSPAAATHGASSKTVPAAVISAVVHAEIVAIRPFVHGNGLVARAMERALVQALGLDPTGVSVPEVGHGAEGGPAYLGALTAYAGGTAAGVGLWLTQGGRALLAGIAEGGRISDAVRAGRLR